MAIGAITRGAKAGQVPANPVYADVISFPGDAAYPTGGSAFDALFKAATKDGRQPIAVIGQDCGGYVPVYDPATGKLKVFYGDNNNAADGPLIEVPNATDLSGVTFRVVVLSQ